jgi:hypothetical protein
VEKVISQVAFQMVDELLAVIEYSLFEFSAVQMDKSKVILILHPLQDPPGQFSQRSELLCHELLVDVH